MLKKYTVKVKILGGIYSLASLGKENLTTSRGIYIGQYRIVAIHDGKEYPIELVKIIKKK